MLGENRLSGNPGVSCIYDYNSGDDDSSIRPALRALGSPTQRAKKVLSPGFLEHVGNGLPANTKTQGDSHGGKNSVNRFPC